MSGPFAACWDAYRTRRLASIGVWMLLPGLNLVASRLSSGLERSFRPRPFNSSYDTMFVAATAGVAVASMLLFLRVRRRVALSGPETAAVVAESSWWNALDLFEVVACAGLAVTSAWAGAPGAAVAWGAACALLASFSARLARAQRGVAWGPERRAGGLSRVTSIALMLLAVLIVSFPVLQPWSGPPEPFVRWHPYSVPAELVWRSVFLSFAIGMLLAASDPFGRHRPFLVMLVTSGYFHSAEMAVDNLLQARTGAPNGNLEHLYGDVLGWFAIASFALTVLVADARSRRASSDGERAVPRRSDAPRGRTRLR